MSQLILLLTLLAPPDAPASQAPEVRTWTAREAFACRTTRMQLPRCNVSDPDDMFTTEFRLSKTSSLICVWTCVGKAANPGPHEVIFRGWQLFSIMVTGDNSEPPDTRKPRKSAELPHESLNVDQHSQALTRLRREAMAFVVGWHSKIVLLPETPAKQAIFSAICQYLDLLGVHLKHEIEYYLSDPTKDRGARAQEFAQQVYDQLSAADHNIANHFGIAANVLLTIRGCNCEKLVPRKVKAKLGVLAQHLDVPPSLRRVPARNLRSWATRIEAYFELRLRMPSSNSQRQTVSTIFRPRSVASGHGLRSLTICRTSQTCQS